MGRTQILTRSNTKKDEPISYAKSQSDSSDHESHIIYSDEKKIAAKVFKTMPTKKTVEDTTQKYPPPPDEDDVIQVRHTIRAPPRKPAKFITKGYM